MRSDMHARSALALALAGAGLLGTVAGCGGGGSTTTGGGGDGTSGEEQVTTAAGTALTEESQQRWSDAIAQYHSAAADGFTPEECSQVISRFEAANSAQGGRFTEGVYMIGVTHASCGHADEARSFYQRALEMNDHFCGARVAAGLEHYTAGRIPQARAEFERAVRDDARCTEGYVNLAIIQRANPSESADALQNLRRALAIQSQFLPAFNQMALLYLDQAIRRGGGQATVAGGTAARATTEEDDDDEDSPRASERSDRQMLDLAEVVCRQAQLINGRYAPIYNTWGLINVQRGDIIGAMAKFNLATQLDPNFYEAWMNFGELTLGFRGYEDAFNAFTRATTLRPQSYDAQIGLGAALRGLGRIDEAQAAYERAVAIDAQRPEAYFNIGLLFHDYRDGAEPTLRQAQQYYRQFAERARGRAGFQEAVDGVTRECPPEPTDARRRRRWLRRGCQPGRIQSIDRAITLTQELQQQQREIEEMQRQMEAQQAQQAAQEGAAGGGEATPPPQ